MRIFSPLRHLLRHSRSADAMLLILVNPVRISCRGIGVCVCVLTRRLWQVVLCSIVREGMSTCKLIRSCPAKVVNKDVCVCGGGGEGGFDAHHATPRQHHQPQQMLMSFQEVCNKSAHVA